MSLAFSSPSTDHGTVNERLPTELGWDIPSEVISIENLNDFSNAVFSSTSFGALEK
jgi:hypothetical protein